MQWSDARRVGRERRTGSAGVVRRWSVLVGALVCAGLVGGLVSPVWAAAPEGDRENGVELGSFAVGDGLEGAIGELDGSFGFALPAGGLTLAWDSRGVGVDSVGLGGGWSFGLATVRVTGGVWVVPSSGETAYEMDVSVPSGLAGYPGVDVRFEPAARGAMVPARADGSVGASPYAYVLHELGGVSTYFDAAGYPIARIVLGGERADWTWERGGTGRLVSSVSADGSVTALDWSDPGRVVVTPGSTVTDPVEGSGWGGRWVIELDGGRVAAVIDPMGANTRVGYDRQGLVERVSDPSGAATIVRWQGSSGALARVERVGVVDEATGAEVSAREWGAQGELSPAGWPMIAEAPEVRSGSGSAFETWVSDGKTRVRSAVDAHGRLAERAVEVTSSSGTRVVQDQTMEYPEVGGPFDPPGAGRQPTAASTTYHDEHGATRVVSESYERDDLGRMVSRTAVDGSVVRRVYDDVVPDGRVLPIGLVLEETTTAADGLVSSTRSELTSDRAAVAATEQWSGREGGELTRVGRVETDVVDGFVTERREFPGGDPASTPVITRWSKQVDPARGTRSVVETVAAGTLIEASTVSVSSLAHGGVLTETDAVGNTSSASYDQAGRQTALEDAAGRRIEVAYRSRQADGVNAVLQTDAAGVTVTETRDVLGRVVRTSDDIDPSGRVAAGFERVIETREYAPGVERVTDAWGGVTQTTQDVFGRDARVTLPSGLVQVAEYDDVAGTATSGVSLTGELADAAITSTSAMDVSGRVTGTTGSRLDGVAVPETVTEFDGLGREVVSIERGLRTETEYDDSGNAVATDLAPVLAPTEDDARPGMTAEREHDGFGVTVEKTLRSGTEIAPGQRRELDELGRVVAQTDQRGVTERTAYTLDGLVAEVDSGAGRVTTNEYDPVTRELVGTRVTGADGSTVASAFRYDEVGRLVAAFDPADEIGTRIAYEHDDHGNVRRTVYPDGAEIRHEYDAHGRKTATVDVDGNRTEYSYDPMDGALVGAAQVDRDGQPVSGVRYAYDEYRRVNLIERDNGVRTEVTYTSVAEVASEVTTGPDGVLSKREYEYTSDGNLASRIDQVRDQAGQLEATRTDYEYDAFDRLIGSSVRQGGSVVGRVLSRSEYVPTIGGDLATETVTTDPDTDAAVTVTRRFEYSAIGELIAITTDGDERRVQAFDAEGSLTESAAGDRYAYDAAGRQIAHTTADGVQITTEYWADGSRKQHSTEAGSTRYYWDGVRLLNEVHETPQAGRGIAGYLIGTNRHARVVRPDRGEAEVSYYGTDRHGNITDRTDEGGAVSQRYAYTDYGLVTPTGDESGTMPAGIGELSYNPFQYAGEYTYRDGTQSLGPRIYDPSYARFLTMDDAPLANRYAYVELNPITKVDPSGRWSESDKTNAFLTTVGWLLAMGGAALMVTTPGALFSVFGAIAFGIAIGDAVLTSMQVIEGAQDTEFTDPRAMEGASRVFFAASLLVGFGGVVGALVKRGTGAKVAKACTELVHMTCLRGSTDETVSLVQGSANVAVRASPHVDADDLAGNLHLMHGWNQSLSQAKFEHLPSMVEGLSDRLTSDVTMAMNALLEARNKAASTMSQVFNHSTAQGMNDYLQASDSMIRTLVDYGARQLGQIERRLNSELWEGVEGASTASGLLKTVRGELNHLLAGRRDSLPDVEEAFEDFVTDF